MISGNSSQRRGSDSSSTRADQTSVPINQGTSNAFSVANAGPISSNGNDQPQITSLPGSIDSTHGVQLGSNSVVANAQSAADDLAKQLEDLKNRSGLASENKSDAPAKKGDKSSEESVNSLPTPSKASVEGSPPDLETEAFGKPTPNAVDKKRIIRRGHRQLPDAVSSESSDLTMRPQNPNPGQNANAFFAPAPAGQPGNPGNIPAGQAQPLNQDQQPQAANPAPQGNKPWWRCCC